MKTINTIESTKQMTGYLRFWFIIVVGITLMIFDAYAPAVFANDDGEIPFDEAVIYFELNDTDGDLGIHALIDGEAWKYLEIEDPKGRKMLNILVLGRLNQQGLTELFFESAEPTFDELTPEDFFLRFPKGKYEIEGITLDGDELESEAWLSHVMPAPPLVTVNDITAAEDCDVDDLPEFDVTEPIVISWDDVTQHHPDLGKPGKFEVLNYEVVVEIDETLWKTSIVLSPDVTDYLIPSEILNLAEFADGEAEIKFEVLVRATNYNQTAVESCFTVFEQDSEIY
jgi:hypothetical protein